MSLNENQAVRRNPSWARDELILALELYMRNPASPPGKGSAEVIKVSRVLNAMAPSLGRAAASDYRNPNGVYMKAMNFRRFDPAVTSSGRVGLTHGNHDEAVVWDLFASDLPRLRAAAANIRAAVASNASAPAVELDPEFEEAEEGRVLTVLHLRRERSRKLVEARKERALKELGRLACEACDLDFGQRYGTHGEGFIEAHHTRPVHMLNPGEKTRVSDLALVCSNCHRMIHRRQPWLSMDQLRVLIAGPTTSL